MLLYFILEAVLNAPQIIAKVDLKTARAVESYGSDGIHMRWHPEDSVLDVFFGESKLEQSVYAALRRAFRSIESFHAEKMADFEFGLVTAHFKHANEELREAVVSFMTREATEIDCRLNHACLIGYDWKEYKRLTQLRPEQVAREFRARYEADLARLRDLIQNRFDRLTLKYLRFEVFFLPFQSVQDFRDAFNEALS